MGVYVHRLGEEKVFYSKGSPVRYYTRTFSENMFIVRLKSKYT